MIYDVKNMGNTMSTLETTKFNGSPIQFNFKLENGLLLKPLIEPEHKYMKEAITNKKALVIYLNEEEYSLLDFTKSPHVHVFFDRKEIVIEIKDYYVVVNEVPSKFLEYVEKAQASYTFFKRIAHLLLVIQISIKLFKLILFSTLFILILLSHS